LTFEVLCRHQNPTIPGVPYQIRLVVFQSFQFLFILFNLQF